MTPQEDVYIWPSRRRVLVYVIIALVGGGVFGWSALAVQRTTVDRSLSLGVGVVLLYDGIILLLNRNRPLLRMNANGLTDVRLSLFHRRWTIEWDDVAYVGAIRSPVAGANLVIESQDRVAAGASRAWRPPRRIRIPLPFLQESREELAQKMQAASGGLNAPLVGRFPVRRLTSREEMESGSAGKEAGGS
jgi:hypothetical protein